jgi:SpoVK/Ycf46/Vps4 family AAA+-type ATPase
MLDDASRRLVFSLIFFVITSVVTYVMSTPGLLGKLQALQGKVQGLHPGLPSMTAHEAQVAGGLVDSSKMEETLASVGGLAHVKEDLMASVVMPLRYHQAFFHPKLHALHVPRGVLFAGPPGCGKTLLARALAKECHPCRFLAVSLSMLEDKYFGETSKRIEAVFSLARKVAPCIIFFDELDSFLRTRSDADQSPAYNLKAELLQQLDGFHTHQAPVLVVGCTNTTASLDAAVRRRLPRVYTIALPNLDERKEILRVHVRSEKVGEETLAWLAEQSEGLSGSDLQAVYRAAAARRIRDRAADPAFHKCAAQACADPRALRALAGNLARLSREHWRHGMGVVRGGKAGCDYRT